ncbi:sensor domain-containing diguanylate cyclase [Shewanella canadensis]|uniref:sensor domain-containing diguanylate cyclase n=1 Tax=Shewanella canadensis TaxID=271096 RepID=UPI00163A7B5F|nr:sensor domain-containing diguanylate cyclase [Shewanella canadensis]
MTERDGLKKRQIDSLDLKFHFGLLGAPLLLLLVTWLTFFNSSFDSALLLKLLLVSSIYTLGYSLSYYLHQGRLNRLWLHLQQIVHINNTTFELVNLSSHYKNEQAFLDALLKKAVSSIEGAEMGSIIRVDPDNQQLHFESAVGINIEKIRQVKFHLEQSFEFRLTEGRCDKVVVIDNIENINSHSSLTDAEQELLLTAPDCPIRSTLSSPIQIDGKLYAMINLDSSVTKAFGHYDRNLVSILTHEAENAIALYQKTRQIQTLANYDSLTSLYNRQRFEERLEHWTIKSHFGCFLILIDLDNLKQINDSGGHQAGDNALRLLARVLKRHWHEHQLVARYGGDEFIAICHGPLENIMADLAKIQQELDSETTKVHFSFGIAEYRNNWQQAFRTADIGMYDHKRSKQCA